MKSKLILLGLALAGSTALLPAPASAQVVAPGFNWTGFYIGAHGGYAWGRSRFDDGFGAFREDTDGGFGGGQIGFNWQTPGSPWVWGFEADISGSNIRTRDTNVLAFDQEYALRSFGTVRGRVGMTFGNMLAYGTGGYAWGNFRFDGGGGDTDSQTHHGWAAGAGLEWAFDPNWSVKLEYLHMQFETRSYFGFIDARSNVDTFKAGINYRFGWSGMPLGR